MAQKSGVFIISLDFELFWGMHDTLSLHQYKENLLGTHTAVIEMLKLFREYQIHATWAIVGMLYYKNTQHLQPTLPEKLPNYAYHQHSAYHYMKKHPIKKEDEKYFFAPSLIRHITQTKHQEIATHTFSHIYTTAKGMDHAAFKADIKTALQTAKKNGSDVTSIIFPRNQINETFLHTCRKLGIKTYRGTEKTFIYRDGSNDRSKYHIRALRLLDQYVNLFGHQTYPPPTEANPLYNLPASRFLMPFSPKGKLLEPLKLRRIKRAMTHAAKNSEVFHLWWHPHNFGVNLKENIHFLSQVLNHYEYLRQTYHFQSFTMKEVTKKYSNVYMKEEHNGNSMEKVYI